MQEVNPKIESSWKGILEDEFRQKYFQQLKSFLLQEKQLYRIYPQGKDIFNAFLYTPFDKVKVVILGQDPYHGDGQAHGLSFSVPIGIQKPPSLQNIFKEISNDLSIPIPQSGNLVSWAKQGVLLLNATLTVRANQAGSHQKKGWERFTDKVIQEISAKKKGVVFLLWGNFAKEKAKYIDQNRHYILQAPHPSPLSAHSGFLGCKHFSETNNILLQQNLTPIDWQII